VDAKYLESLVGSGGGDSNKSRYLFHDIERVAKWAKV
jgi:hypothetical protein